MLLPLEVSTDLHIWDWNGDPTSDLQGIKVYENDKGEAVANVAAGTTNDQFRKFCLANGKVCLPFNIIMVEVSLIDGTLSSWDGIGLSFSFFRSLLEVPMPPCVTERVLALPHSQISLWLLNTLMHTATSKSLMILIICVLQPVVLDFWVLSFR